MCEQNDTRTRRLTSTREEQTLWSWGWPERRTHFHHHAPLCWPRLGVRRDAVRGLASLLLPPTVILLQQDWSHKPATRTTSYCPPNRNKLLNIGPHLSPGQSVQRPSTTSHSVQFFVYEYEYSQLSYLLWWFVFDDAITITTVRYVIVSLLWEFYTFKIQLAATYVAHFLQF